MGFLICFCQKSQQFLKYWSGWVVSESLEDTKDGTWYSQKFFSQCKIELPTLQELWLINPRSRMRIFLPPWRENHGKPWPPQRALHTLPSVCNNWNHLLVVYGSLYPFDVQSIKWKRNSFRGMIRDKNLGTFRPSEVSPRISLTLFLGLSASASTLSKSRSFPFPNTWVAMRSGHFI